jgi:hypothetical protein
MLTAAGGIGFLAPAGFDDRTTYRFADAAERETVDVGFGDLPASVDTAAEALAERSAEMSQLERRAPRDYRFDPPVKTRVGSAEGTMFRYTGRDGHYRYQEWVAIVLLDEVSYVQIACQASALDGLAARKLLHILDSVSNPAGLRTGEAAGFHRYQAGRISLEIPEKLDPPWAYRFVSPDDQARIELAVYDGANEKRRSSAGKDAPAGAEHSVVEVGEQQAVVSRSIFTAQERGEPARFAMYRSVLVLGEGSVVVVTGRSSEESESALRAGLLELLQSIRKAD